MLDTYWFGDVTRISPEAPVPVININKRESRPGGAGNVAINAAALGNDCTLMTVYGADPERDVLSGLLQEAGVDVYGFKYDGMHTTTKLRILSGQHILRVDRDAHVDGRILDDLVANFCAIANDYDAVIMSDYGKGVLSDFDHTSAMIKATSTPVFVDPKKGFAGRYRGAIAITPNVSELRELTGQWKNEPEMLESAGRLREELGLGALLLTRGMDGMSLFTQDGVVHIPAAAREVADVSGAGDTVIAAFASMYVRGHNFHEAAIAANWAAGVVVGKHGTSSVTWDEVFPGRMLIPTGG